MHLRCFISFLLIIIVFHFTRGETQDDLWTHKVFVDTNVTISWNSSDSEWLVMEMSAPVKGYVSLGFSPNGQMRGSDIALGWVDSEGVPQLLDMYAEANTTPKKDDVQDYELLSGKEEGGVTTIRFRRKWNTCDDLHDMKIGNDTVRLIWAINEEDPVSDKPKYHSESRGVRRVFVRSQAQHVPFPDESMDSSIKSWDVRMDKNVIDKEDDIYFCKIAKFPKMDKKHHLIGYRPLLQPGNEFSIHHIIMYECIVPQDETEGRNGTEGVFEKYVDHPGGRCYTPNMPPEWGQFCTSIPILWTAGSEGNMFPSNTGNPLGEEHGGTTYFMFEVHYDNPQLKSFVDSSGFRLFYTDNLRQFDSAAILVGQKISPFHVVPHGMSSFTSVGYCTSECTSQTIPEDGITVTTVLLHAHLAGKRIALRHIRNGEELSPIAIEHNYDYNYQQTRVLNPPRKILPGDELITECEYNTEGKSKPAFGGLGTRDEMCMAFVYYYPKIELQECKIQQEFKSFLSSLGVDKVEGEILRELNMPYEPKPDQKLDYGDSPFYLKNSSYEEPLNALDAMLISDPKEGNPSDTVGGLIRSMNWTAEGSSIQEKWLEGKHYAFCTGPVKKRFPLKNYIVSLPKYEKFVEPQDEKCSKPVVPRMAPYEPKPSKPFNIPGHSPTLRSTQFDLRQRQTVH